MKSKFKKVLFNKENIKFYVIAFIIVVFIFLGVFSGIIFKGTTFESVISKSVGKFFNVVSFFQNSYVYILESITIIIFMWLVSLLLKFILLLVTRKGNRSKTIVNLLISLIKYSTVLIAIFLILSAWGVQTKTLLAGAGIIGLALSFGAQSLIEDVISGLFIIFEKQFVIGDVVEIGDFRGTVVDIGIRVTKFEDIFGDIKTINNSDIRSAINTSSELSVAICEVGISYSQDIERVETVIKDNLEIIKEKIPAIEKGPHYAGIQKLADSSVILRITARTQETKKYQVVRDLNREIKILFDRNSIEIPFPQLVIHNAKE